MLSAGIAYAQSFETEDSESLAMSRGSIPEELLRPGRSEDPRYPIDTVIGPLGQGETSAGAYQFAGRVAAALCAGNKDAASLSAMNSIFLENYLNTLGHINPRNYRLGGGREEPDGSCSFLVRFVGREEGITGELFIRQLESETGSSGAEQTTRLIWVFEDLILEDARSREAENREDRHRFDFTPYERFF